MLQGTSNTDELVVRIPEALWNNKELLRSPSFRSEQFTLFAKTGVRITTGYRTTENGYNQIQSLVIPTEEQRNAILTLFHNPALYAVMPRIVQRIYELGLDTDDEKRHFAALAIAELSKYLSFLELIELCIDRWANSGIGKHTAALTLVVILEESTHREDVFQLLRHWCISSNLKLVATAIIVYFHVYQQYPEETLATIEKVTLSKNLPLTQSVAVLLDMLCKEQPTLVTKQLCSWSLPTSDNSLRSFSAKRLLANIDIDVVTKDSSLCNEVVQAVHSIWEKGGGGNRYSRQEWQKLLTNKLESLAIVTLRLTDSAVEQSRYRIFFSALDKKCANTKQNRLRFYLARWQKAAAKDAKLPEVERLHLDFFSLVDSP